MPITTQQPAPSAAPSALPPSGQLGVGSCAVTPAVSILSESGRELEVLIEREFGCEVVHCSLYFDEHYTQVECLDEDLSEAEQEAILAAWRGEPEF